MDLYYFTSHVKEKLNKHACQDYMGKVERSNPLSFKLITTKTNRIFTDFADGKKRVIARDVTSHIAPSPVKFKRIIMFIDLVLWGSKEWEILNQHGSGSTDKIFERMNRISEPELLEVKRMYEERITDRAEQLRELPGEYLPWLGHPHWKDSGGDYGLTLCESSISESSITSLPFAFAGDPLQTLNPTGFSWDRFTALFFTEMCKVLELRALDRFNEDKRVELSYNYRSDCGIVKFSNTIQYLRSLMTNEQVSPQRPWFDSHKLPPEKFIFSRNITGEQFLKSANETIIIVPTDEDGEKEYISNDPTLSQLVPDTSISANVFTSISAKGLEFDKVILYNFGDYFKEMGEKTLASLISQKEMDFKYRYFFNRLYVAATRARKSLFVVDTEEGEVALWSHLSQEGLKEKERFEEWNAELEYPLDGNDSTSLKETDPLKNAYHLKEMGISMGKPDLLEKALSVFAKAVKQQDVEECRAWKLRFEGHLEEAGKLFETFDKNEARACFWEGEHWQSLKTWFDHHQPGSLELEYKIACFMSASKEVEPDTMVTDGIALIERFPDLSADMKFSSQYNKSLERLFEIVNKEREPISKDLLIKLAEAIAFNELQDHIEISVDILYDLGDTFA